MEHRTHHKRMKLSVKSKKKNKKMRTTSIGGGPKSGRPLRQLIAIAVTTDATTAGLLCCAISCTHAPNFVLLAAEGTPLRCTRKPIEGLRRLAGGHATEALCG